MKKMILISYLVLFPFTLIFADEKNEKTAKTFMVKIFSGDVESSLELSGIPFSYDRKKIVKDIDKLRIELGKIVKQNGSQSIEITSIKEINKTKGKHKDLKDEIIIYEIGVEIKNSNEKLQIFIRKSDGKVVGIYG